MDNGHSHRHAPSAPQTPTRDHSSVTLRNHRRHGPSAPQTPRTPVRSHAVVGINSPAPVLQSFPSPVFDSRSILVTPPNSPTSFVSSPSSLSATTTLCFTASDIPADIPPPAAPVDPVPPPPHPTATLFNGVGAFRSWEWAVPRYWVQVVYPPWSPKPKCGSKWYVVSVGFEVGVFFNSWYVLLHVRDPFPAHHSTGKRFSHWFACPTRQRDIPALGITVAVVTMKPWHLGSKVQLRESLTRSLDP